MEKYIGKIQSVEFGFGGYDNAMIGVSFSLGGKSWGTQDFWGDWSLERSDSAKWSEQDRIKKLGKVVMKINKILKDANKSSVNDLVDIPIEVTFVSGTLNSWRILTEVL